MPTPSDAEVTRGIKYYSVTPDLTRINHHLLTDLKRDARVKAAWSIDGHIRFCFLADEKTKYQVEDVFSSLEEIISSCVTAASNIAGNLTTLVKSRGTERSDSDENVLTADDGGRPGSDRRSSPGRSGSRSPVQAELRGGRRLPPPVGTRRPGFRAEVETSKKK